MKLSKKILLVLTIVLSLLLGACSKAPESTQRDASMEATPAAMPGMAAPESTKEAEYEAKSSPEDSSLEPEKVIVTVNLYYETTTFDNSIAAIKETSKSVGGFIQDSSINFGNYNYSGSVKNASFTVRVPADKVEEFKASLGEKGGALVSESTNKSDATKSYKDTEARIKVLDEKEKRLLALLEKADTMENIIAIENSLSETIAEKEILKANLLDIDDLVSYSTLYISVQEVKTPTVVNTTKTPFLTKLGNAISDSLSGFGAGIQDLIIMLIYALPYLLFLGILIWILKFIYVRVRRIVKLKSKRATETEPKGKEDKSDV